jgi:two-component system chemotaxis response regulator CheY
VIQCKNILVVEDNDDIRDAISEALELEGFSVETARNGKEGLAKLRKTAGPTLVLLDLMMPVMNGWEFLDAQKKDPTLRNHRVVTISAVDPSISIDDPTPLDTDGSIRKPLSLESIWQEVRKHCLPTNLSAA